MPFHQHQASASIYVHNQHLMYPVATSVAPFQHTQNTPLYSPHRSGFQRMTPPFNLRPLDTPPYRPYGHYLPLSPTLSTPPPATPKQDPSEDMNDLFAPPVSMPSTPKWFGAPLPNLPPEHMLQPPRTPIQSPYKSAPAPAFDSPFSKLLDLYERDSERASPVTRSSVDSSPSRVVTPPMLSSNFPETRSLVYQPTHKKVMESHLLQQPASSTPLCEIMKEGQICHLRRYERAGVFVRSTVKFDKAFKHLSNLRENMQHLVIGLKSIPTVFTVDLVTDAAVVSLLQSLPNLIEIRLHGFTKLTKQSFDAALIHCPKLRVLAITGTRVPGPEPRKIVFSNGRPQAAGGTGSLSADVLRSLMPNNGPIRGMLYVGRQLRFIDLSFQYMDETLARAVTGLSERYGELVIMRELQTTTERYKCGIMEVSEAVDGSRCQGLSRPINPVASTVGWPAA